MMVGGLMKKYTVYVCEKCGKESRNFDDIKLCEAKHIGLNTLEDKHAYDTLKSKAAKATARRCSTNNEQTQQAEDAAYNLLIAFEKEHNVQFSI
jgi:predicted nucleic acid binding AN1-type Zn finger protein